MIQLKTRFPAVAVSLMLTVLVASFDRKPFEFDGGTITNPNITILGAGIPVVLNATKASGCEGPITYQWQQSAGNANFIDIPNATDTSYQSGSIMTDTYFRRKAICAGGEFAYTNNIATVIVQP